MSDEELIARLRAWDGTPFDEDAEAAADRIEALVKERDEALEWLSASQGYIVDAVFALDKQEKAEAKLAAMEAIATQWKARAERLEAAIRELKRCWYQGDLTENDFAAALKGADHE